MRPRRQKLSKRLSKTVRSNLKETWNYPGDFWPLQDRAGLITVNRSDITETEYNHLAQLVRLHAPKVYEVGEAGDFEFDSAIFHPDGYETVFCDESMTWIVYASLDGTISFGGSWLTEFIQKTFAGRILR